MTKKNVFTIITGIILFLLTINFFAWGYISLSTSAGGGIQIQDYTSMNHIIDYHIDEAGNIYYLDYRNGETYKYVISNSGDLIMKNKLPAADGDTDLYYTQITTNTADNIYVSVTATTADTLEIEKAIIKKYDQQGNYVEDRYAAEQKEPMEMTNPFAATGSRLLNIQFVDDSLYLFDKKDEERIVLIEIKEEDGDLSEVEHLVMDLDTRGIREIIITPREEIFFLSRQADIYRINEYASIEKLNISYNGYDTVIPYDLASDQQGNLYFTDAHNGKYVEYLSDTLSPNILYDFSQMLDEDKGVTFGDLRNIKMINDNLLAGHSMIGAEGQSYFTFIDNGQVQVIDRINLSIQQGLKTYGYLLLITFAVIMFLVFLGATLFSQKIGLLAKQILIFLPVFLAVMIGLSFYLTDMIRDNAINMTYNKVTSLADATANLIDKEEMRSLNQSHPHEDFGPDFLAFDEKLRTEKGNTYHVTYFVKDGRIFMGVSGHMQSHTPIEYLYNQDVAGKYYEALNTGEIQRVESEDSLGEWMYALAPVIDGRGETIGIIEQGRYAGYIYDEIDENLRHFMTIFSSIALAVALVFIFMVKYSLRPLDMLKLSVAEVAAGRWNSKVNIQTKDEFRDIGFAFNRMSQRIQEYIDEVTRLNKAYIKFVPEKFISLLGKKTVLDVKSGEKVVGQMTVMYIHIRNIEKHSQKMNMEESYHFINKVLELIAEHVTGNQGVIERFEGAGAIALFKESTQDAMTASLALMEDLNRFNREINEHIDVGITISSGQVLLGIVGHENRLATTVISDEVENTHILEKVATRLGIKLLLTEFTVAGLENLEKYNYRYAGRVKGRESGRVMDVYEFIDSYTPEDKNLKFTTRPLLEEGVAYYQAKELMEARRKFIEVIRTDKEDTLARAYIYLCEKYGRVEADHWEGILDYY